MLKKPKWNLNSKGNVEFRKEKKIRILWIKKVNNNNKILFLH
jgi:hypothetical protein